MTLALATERAIKRAYHAEFTALVRPAPRCGTCRSCTTTPGHGHRVAEYLARLEGAAPSAQHAACWVRDGYPTCQLEAERRMGITLMAYHGMSRRPRPAHAWAYIQSMLWTARAQCVVAGILDPGSLAYRFVCDFYADATARVRCARLHGAA